MENLSEDDRKRFSEFIDDYRAKRKASSGGQMPAREMLEVVGDGLTDVARQAMEAVVQRDEMGPHAGDVPPDFNLKLIGGSEDRVRISSFKEAETRRFDFRQLYLTPFPCSG